MKRQRSDLKERIVDAAFARGAEVGWARVRLHDVARDLGIPLSATYPYFADLDAVGEAMLSRADRAMLDAANARGFARLPPKVRVERLIRAWLAALDPHRREVRAFLRYKFAAAHIHLRAALVVRLSRTIQWLREAARFDATGFRHDLEEVGLTALFVATVVAWLGDDSAGGRNAHAFLTRALAAADRAMAALYPAGRSSRT
jgi:AcrR family transcriptional regulator